MSRTVGGSGYARDKVYGDRGQDTERIQPYIPTYVLSEIGKIVARGETPFDTGHDFIRDALVHSVVWWNEQTDVTNDGQVFKQRAVAQSAIAAYAVREQTVGYYEQALRDASRDPERWETVEEETQEAIVLLGDYSELARRLEMAIVSNRPR